MTKTKNSFEGFPTHTLLESGKIPIEEFAEIALREGQSTNPLYRVHRWFARRLSSQFRGILTALSLSNRQQGLFWSRYFGDIPLTNAIVLDPFVGGGTSLIEASRCGSRVIGYDIDPVATMITRFELAASSYTEALPSTATDIMTLVSSQILPFHTSVSANGDEVIVLHHFWVETVDCENCGHEFDLHPHHRLALDQKKGRQWVFCHECGEIGDVSSARQTFRCRCGACTEIDQGPWRHGKVECPHCEVNCNLSDARRLGDRAQSRWRLFAQEYLEETTDGLQRKFKPVTDDDRCRYRGAAEKLRKIECHQGSFAPSRPIPAEGRSDRRPLIHGFRTYRELFNERQLLHLSLLGRAIAEIPDVRTKQLFGVAFSDHLAANCMYTGYAFGYRRTSPLFSIHGYRHIVRPVEINPWLNGIGRGTFPNALEKIRKAISFAKAPKDLDRHLNGGRRGVPSSVGPANGLVRKRPSALFQGSARAVIKTGSAEHLSDIPTMSVDLVLTDPPYFDNLSYSELSDFYLAWHQVLGLAEPPYNCLDRSAPILENLGIPSRSDESVERYRETLKFILSEIGRVLRKSGLCIFTFHHRSATAWLALAEALISSNLHCTAVVPMRGEGQGGLHSYAGTLKWDAVMVCRKGKYPMVNPCESLVVRPYAIRKAAKRTEYYIDRLGANKKIGFRELDGLNFFRALLVSSAFWGTINGGRMSLESALNSSFTDFL